MQPKLCNIVVTDCSNQSHSINEIYNVRLYQSMNFLNAPHTVVHLTLREIADDYSSHIVINLFRITVERILVVVIVTLMIMFLVLSSWLI